MNFNGRLAAVDWVITGCEQAGQAQRTPMDLAWVRGIHRQCQEVGVAHYFKQYYVGNQLQTDGQLDGVVCQEWPQGTAMTS